MRERDKIRVSGLLRNLHPADREERQTQGIGHEKGATRSDPEPYIPECHQGRRQNHQEIRRVGDPEDGIPIEQDVPQRPTSYRRHDSDDSDAEQVQALAARG
jgi:hypothetical protein